MRLLNVWWSPVHLFGLPAPSRYSGNMAVRAAAVLCMTLGLIGCATSRLQDQVRQAANHPVSEYRDWPAAQAFAEVSQAAGMDPSKVYLAVTRGIDGANVWSVGDGMFLITPSVRDGCGDYRLLRTRPESFPSNYRDVPGGYQPGPESRFKIGESTPAPRGQC